MVACFVADANRKIGVLPVFEFSTNLCDQFSEKCDIYGGWLLVGIVFFFFELWKWKGSSCSLELKSSDTMWKI